MELPQLSLFLHNHNELISNCIREHHCWEPLLTEVLREVLERVDCLRYVFVDVGANLGYFTCVAAKWNKHLRVVAFEPMHANLQLLRKNIVANELVDRVTVFPVAVGNEGNYVKRYFTTSHNMGVCSGMGTRLEASVTSGKTEEWVQERSLPVCLHEACGDAKYIIKMDVEEAELKVLTTFTPAVWEATGVLILEIMPLDFDAILELLKPHFAGAIQLGCVTMDQRPLQKDTKHLRAFRVQTLEALQTAGNGGEQCNVVFLKQSFMDKYVL